MKKLQFWLPVCLYALAIICIGVFKVGNTDFWWHIKAGQLLRDTGWISVDPFAYTRIGQPYLAHHEWLAQVILSLVFDYGGVIGITVLRILIILIVFSLPVLLHRKNLWFNGALAVLAAAGARPAFTDRPQLFSFLFFSLITCLCFAYLESDSARRKHILIYLPIGIMLWSNLHGAASLVGIAVIGALLLQRIASGALKRPERKWFLLLLPALAVAPLISPSGTANITYIISLLTDKTAQSIAEWQPAAWNIYLQHTLPLWIASVIALITTRRNIIFSGLLLLGLGYLSRSAVRHETLFLIAALALTVYQLRYNKRWNALLVRFYQSIALFGIFGILGLLGILFYAHMRIYDVNRIDHLFGIGLFEPGRGAYELLERENITGLMFNNYNIGGELLYRGYPERKVFVDGRNIDYGYDFLMNAINAGVDESVWHQLEYEYSFTHAVIYYDLQAEKEPIPFVDLLDKLPEWNLVYLDDWVAVYRKDAKDSQGIHFITPKALHRQIMPEQLGQADFDKLQNELNHMIELRPDGVKARLYLARLYMLIGAYEPAEILLNEALDVQKHNYLIYVGFAQLAMEKGDWPHAWYYLKKAKAHAGYTGVQLDEEMLEAVKKRAEL